MNLSGRPHLLFQGWLYDRKLTHGIQLCWIVGELKLQPGGEGAHVKCCPHPFSTDAKVHTCPTGANCSKANSIDIFLSCKLFIKFTANNMEGMILTAFEDFCGMSLTGFRLGFIAACEGRLKLCLCLLQLVGPEVGRGTVFQGKPQQKSW